MSHIVINSRVCFLSGALLFVLCSTAMAETIAEFMEKQARYHYFGKEYEMAEAFYVKALEHSANDVPSVKLVQEILDPLSDCCSVQKKYAQAEKYSKIALKICTDLRGPDDGLVARQYAILGSIYKASNRYDEAEDSFVKCLAVRRKDESLIPSALNDLGRLYALQGKESLAEECFKESIEISDKELTIDGNDTGARYDLEKALEGQSNLYAKAGRSTEAAELSQRLKDLRSKNKNP